jgi:putative two-component system response regulator
MSTRKRIKARPKRLSMPVAPVPALGEQAAVKLVATPSEPRVLVVDDDAQVRALLTHLLGFHKIVVEEANSAEAALLSLRGRPPDLVILDLRLPGVNGDEVLREIRTRDHLKLIPVIMVSGNATRNEKLHAIQMGVTDFLSKPFDGEALVARVLALLRLKALTDQLEDAERVIVALARTIDARDPYTAGHSGRVSMYADLLGEHIELPEAELKALHQGTLFHDLGKIAVRDEVLNKAGRLSAEEFEEMKRHPEVGRDLLRHMRTLAASLPVVAHHHEHLDGSGYPDKLSGAQIPRIVRIASIADVYDGMTSARPYREAMPAEEALQELAKEAARGWWDADLVKEFRGALENLRDGRAGLGLARRARRAA